MAIPLVMFASGIVLCFSPLFHWFRISWELRAGVWGALCWMAN
jgi:hypothetical protein